MSTRCTHLILAVVLCITTVSGIVHAAARAAPEHSIHSWDYSDELGSVTWWPLWYPSCTLPYQSPIDVVAADAVPTPSSESLELHTTDKQPIRYVDATVAYDSAFNMVECDVSVARERFHIYWSKDVNAPNKPEFQLKHITFRFPSEHKLNGEFLRGELRYSFQSTGTYPADEPSVITNDDIDDSTIIAVSVFLKEVNDNSGDVKIESMLSQIMAGYASGTSRVLPYLPDVERLYTYKGSQTIPPCRGNVQYFIGEKIFPIETSTMKLFEKYGPIWEDYRSVVPLDGRPLRLVNYNPVGLEPQFRTTPADIAYVLERKVPYFKNLGLKYAIVMAASVCVLTMFYLLKLLLDRFTYTVPYNLTWRKPDSEQEVFGTYLRYGVETGVPKILSEDGRVDSSSWESDSMTMSSEHDGNITTTGVHKENPLKGSGKGIVISGYAESTKDEDY